jgi:hypothetical protein
MENNYEYERYLTTIANVTNTLEQYGVAIIPNILNVQECENMKLGMWNYLETITGNLPIPISRANPQTWKTFKELYPKHSMLIQHWSIGHAQFIWDVRTNPKAIAPFEKIWNVPKEDLLVSFDAASFHFPPETTKFGWENPNKIWLHTDQSYLRNEFECVQSWVNAYDTNGGDASLTILEGSHRFHGDFRNHFEQANKDDWYILNEAELLWYTNTKGCVKRSIRCPAGSMVLWDSRTIHSGKQPEKTRAQPNYRCVVYLSYSPRIKATGKSIEKKILAWENLRTTSHWAHKPKLFPKLPRTYGMGLPDIVQIPRPVINNIGFRLIGFEHGPEEE